MDDDRDDASHASSFTFDMNLNSPGSVDSNDINRQEPRQHVLPPNIERIVAERVEIELRHVRAARDRDYRQLTDHFRAERDNADRLVDEFLQNEIDRIVEERVQVELRRLEAERIEAERLEIELRRAEAERIEAERLRRNEVECVVVDLLHRIEVEHNEVERLRRFVVECVVDDLLHRIEDEHIEAERIEDEHIEAGISSSVIR